MNLHRTFIGLLLTIPSLLAAQSIDNQIRAEVARYVSVVNQGNPRALAELYLVDGNASTLGDGQIYVGWPAILDVVESAYEQFRKIRMTVDSVTVLPLGSTAALAVMRYQWLLGEGDAVSTTGAMTLVFIKTRGGWKVAHDHTSTLPVSAEQVSPEPMASEVHARGPPRPATEMRTCVVVRIVDGDTIDCQRLGRVRLIGMDTPEMNQEPYGADAARAFASLIPAGTTVHLERDIEARDRYDRVLAYVWRDSVMVNWWLVRAGWAVLLTYPPNVRYVEWFTEAQRHAREDKAGLWASGGFNCLPVDRRHGRCD